MKACHRPHRLSAPLRSALPLLAALAACACRSAPEEPEPRRPHSDLAARQLAPKPFPATFQKPVVLVARAVLIEGPADLLEHLALRPEPDVFTYVTRTTEAGLLQELRRRPGTTGSEIRCQLDNWQIVALESMTVLQRPGEVPVRVVAEGNAAYLPADGSPERREPRLVFHVSR